jgi:hypothetical protein
MSRRNSYRGLAACIPPIMRPRNIGCGWTLGVTILAIVKTVFGVGWHTERGAKAIALYIGAAAKWARIKFDVTHVLDSAMLTNAMASKIIERCVTVTGWISGNAGATKFSACCFKTQECFLPVPWQCGRRLISTPRPHYACSIRCRGLECHEPDIIAAGRLPVAAEQRPIGQWGHSRAPITPMRSDFGAMCSTRPVFCIKYRTRPSIACSATPSATASPALPTNEFGALKLPSHC